MGLLPLIISIWMFTFSSYCFASAGNDKASNHSLLVPGLFPIIVVILLFDPKVTVKNVVFHCNTQAGRGKKHKMLKMYLTHSFSSTNESSWLLDWQPGKIIKIKNDGMFDHQKVVRVTFQSGVTCLFYLDYRTKIDKGTVSNWLVSGIDMVA